MKLLIFALIIFTSCASREEKETKLTEQAQAVKKASAIIHSTTQKKIKGTVIFEERPEGISVTADLEGLKSNAKLGFHVHQNGVCEGPDYKSAGDHFNPNQKPHAGPEQNERHMGDMGNLATGKDGKSTSTVTLKGASLDQVIGKAVLIHAKQDDFKTQPSGNSGKRIACGLIRPVE